MEKRTMSMVALSVAMAFSMLGIASAEKPVVVEVEGEPPLTLEVGFTPKWLPEKGRAPIVLRLSGKVRAEDDSQPPALRELALELDRNILIDARGFPVCRPSLGPRAHELPEECRETLLGEGSMTISTQFPEQPSILAKTKSFVVNGGKREGETTLYVLTYLKKPITKEIVTTVKITRERKGRFGTKVVVSIPVIAGGAGSIADLHLALNRRLKVEGEPFSVIGAKCPDGRLQAHALAKFEDGTRAEAEVTRPCIGR